ncbi:MAG: hypothetical protein AAFR88_09730 [Pseudomonadota bacterium]
MFKAVALGAVLSWSVALVIGTQGSSGGSLAIYPMAVGDFDIYWSWPLFCGGTGLSWAIIILQR